MQTIRESIMPQTIFALWDLEITGTGMGAFLIFQEELLMYRSLLNAQHIEMYVYLGDINIPLSYLASLAQLNPFLTALHFIKDKKEFVHHFPAGDVFQWPSLNVDNNCSYFGSTLHIQKLWMKTKKMFLLQSPPSIMIQAKNWLKSYVPYGHYPVTIHLKNNNVDSQSNANQEEWLKLLKKNKRHPLKFILIGNEPYDERFYDCPNCVITQKKGGCLDLELALIQLSFFFMGMSSGPCNLAVLSDLPYLVWKHPDHHSHQMDEELDENGQLIFSNHNQKFIRGIDTFERLDHELNTLYKNLMMNR